MTTATFSAMFWTTWDSDLICSNAKSGERKKIGKDKFGLQSTIVCNGWPKWISEMSTFFMIYYCSQMSWCTWNVHSCTLSLQTKQFGWPEPLLDVWCTTLAKEKKQWCASAQPIHTNDPRIRIELARLMRKSYLTIGLHLIT